MRPFIFLLALTFTTFYANSQKVRIGIVAGPAFSGTTREDLQFRSLDSAKERTRTAHGVLSYFGGVVASFPFGKHLIFRPQIQYVEKGWKNRVNYTYDAYNTDYDVRIKAHCIDLQLNFVYNAPTRNGRFFIGLGPYVSYALSGDIHNGSDNTDTKLTFSSPSSDSSTDTESVYYANRFDIGGNVIAGYEFRNGLFFSLNYSHGFRDFRTELVNAPNPRNKNTIVGLAIGYMFK